MFWTLISSSMATNARILAESRIPACPMTRSRGSPPIIIAAWDITSKGLVRMIKIASGDASREFSTDERMMLVLASSRSSRLIPGFRGSPAVITTMSELAVSLKSLVPTILTSEPITGIASVISSALPCGMPSTMSTNTRSASSRSASQ